MARRVLILSNKSKLLRLPINLPPKNRINYISRHFRLEKSVEHLTATPRGISVRFELDENFISPPFPLSTRDRFQLFSRRFNFHRSAPREIMQTELLFIASRIPNTRFLPENHRWKMRREAWRRRASRGKSDSQKVEDTDVRL